jgi:hypothetical protein
MHDSGLSGGCIDSVVEGLQSFVSLYQQHISGDEKSEAQTFLGRFFRAFGHDGAMEAGAVYEQRSHNLIDLNWKLDPNSLIRQWAADFALRLKLLGFKFRGNDRIWIAFRHMFLGVDYL